MVSIYIHARIMHTVGSAARLQPSFFRDRPVLIMQGLTSSLYWLLSSGSLLLHLLPIFQKKVLPLKEILRKAFIFFQLTHSHLHQISVSLVLMDSINGCRVISAPKDTCTWSSTWWKNLSQLLPVKYFADGCSRLWIGHFFIFFPTQLDISWSVINLIFKCIQGTYFTQNFSGAYLLWNPFTWVLIKKIFYLFCFCDARRAEF